MTDETNTTGERRSEEANDLYALDSALAQLGLGIGVVKEGKLLYANEALVELLGFERDELFSGDIATLLNLRHRESLEEQYRSRIAGDDAPARFVVTVEHASGQPIDLEISTVLDTRDPSSVLCVARDITEATLTERQIRQSHKMQAIGQLATGIAHDFNNYLTALRLTSEALEDWVQAPEGRTLISELEQLTIGAARLTRQLLAFGGRDIGQPTVLDVNVAIFETMTLLERLLGERVELVTRLQPGLPPVQADEGQFQQIIMNLVMNARDAIEDSGRVILQTSVHEHAPMVRVEVHDDGRGMDRSVIERAFEPYFTTNPEEHTGMGLAIVYGVVHQLNGTINIDSAPGEGTVVTVELPAVEAPFAPPAIDEDAETVLLVEDEATLRQLLSAGLRRHGYRVVAVANGDEAMRHIDSEEPITTLVTDLVIPGVSGKSVIQAFRDARPDGAVVAISGYSETLDMDAWDSNRMEFLRKPFSAVDLVEAIERAGES
jgi:PAS domain S-box-containing protein